MHPAEDGRQGCVLNPGSSEVAYRTKGEPCQTHLRFIASFQLALVHCLFKYHPLFISCFFFYAVQHKVIFRKCIKDLELLYTSSLTSLHLIYPSFSPYTPLPSLPHTFSLPLTPCFCPPPYKLLHPAPSIPLPFCPLCSMRWFCCFQVITAYMSLDIYIEI